MIARHILSTTMNDALIDTVLAGRYRILFPIAKGGMGAV